MAKPTDAIGDLSRRDLLKTGLGLLGLKALGGRIMADQTAGRPNVLYIMCDQQRADTIAALGNERIYTPNFDRLVRRGLSFTNAYSTCPVCVPARYTIRTGCEPPTTGIYQNGGPDLVEGQAAEMEQRCGPYLARRMHELGYRTFGVGKFHTGPWDEELGYDVHLHSEELYGTNRQRQRDDFSAWIAREHPQYDWIEALQGERTEMYYMPQMSPLPAELTVERWAADRAVEQLRIDDTRPYFGLVSFIGPQPALRAPSALQQTLRSRLHAGPVCGDIAVDHADEQIPWMNQIIWAEDINDSHARILKSRYYGEITYIDDCLGRILDAVEARPDADDTLICFFSDHGDHMGDHHAWQKESFFEAACHVPFLLSWPRALAADRRRDDLVCLTDLFGIATTAAGSPDMRQGADVLGAVAGGKAVRERVVGYYGTPGSTLFKMMVREGEWKYIYMANGGREQLFNTAEDPDELHELAADKSDVATRLRDLAAEAAQGINVGRALEAGKLKALPYRERPRNRIYQFDRSRGVTGFPAHPRDVLDDWERR